MIRTTASPSITIIVAIASVLAASLFTFSKAQADVTVFTDRAAWEAAAGTPGVTEDFESFLADDDFSFGFTDQPNGFRLIHFGGSAFRNLIDTDPIAFGASGNGTPAASLFVDADPFIPDSVLLVLDSESSAVGFDLVNNASNSGEGFFVSLRGTSGVTNLSQSVDSGTSGFVGFVADPGELITAVEFEGRGDRAVGSGEGFFLDNFAAVTVPEPSGLLLAIFGLLAARRRREAAS